MTTPLLAWRGRPILTSPAVVVPFADSFVDQTWPGYVSFWVSSAARDRGARELARTNPTLQNIDATYVAIPYTYIERDARWIRVAIPATEATRWAMLSLWGEDYRNMEGYLGPLPVATRDWLGMTPRAARRITEWED